jgi:ABC-type transport system involved in multi-copper enzyme maturation permease subunit
MLGPIFNREWLTLPRRSRHYLHRVIFLGSLWILLLTVWQTTVGWERAATLGDHARFGLVAFHLLAYVQLGLLLFFSALAAASTVSQEKDRRTFVLLLLTDLRNYEIVLGKLFGSLLQIVLFLAGTVPILALMLLLGGIAWEQIMDAVVILFTTALAAGSLGGLIALWRERTFQALALTVLALVLYLCLVRALALVPNLLGLIWEESLVSRTAVEVWQTWCDPFLALARVLDPPMDWSGLPPAQGLALVMLIWTVLLNAIAMVKLRVWNPSGEPIIQPEQVAAEAEEKDRAKAHAAPGPARHVWANPILWREIATRAYGRRPFLVKLAYFVVFGLVCYSALVLAEPRAWAAAYGLVPVAILSLLLISAQAVTSITSERDVGALDLLMVTDLTPREFIYGKLLGILYNTKEYIVPPLVLTAIYAMRGQLSTPPRGHPELLLGRNLESLFCILVGTLILMAFTKVLGIHVALRNDNSRLAVINTLGTVFFLSVGTLICIYLILINGRFEYQWLSFSAFIFAGVGGLWWVLSGDRPSTALTLASWACPFAVFYSITNILIGRPGTHESTDPFVPFLVTGGAFSFTLAAMLVPLLSEFDVAVGRTGAGGD